MFQRKRSQDYFPDYRLNLVSDSVGKSRFGKYVITGTYTNCYNKASIKAGYPPEQRVQVSNFYPQPKIPWFGIHFDKSYAYFKIEFCDEKIFESFRQQYKDLMQYSLKPHNFSPFFHHTDATSITYSFMIGQDWTAKRNMINQLLLAIHECDPLDFSIIKHLEAHFEFLQLPMLKKFIEQEQRIRLRLDRAYARGGLMGLFSQTNLPFVPKEMANEIGQYLNEQSIVNTALTCKPAALLSKDENLQEDEAIKNDLALHGFGK